MLHLIRLIIFAIIFFIGYKVFPLIWEDQLGREIAGALLAGFIVVVAYALYENRENRLNETKNIRGPRS